MMSKKGGDSANGDHAVGNKHYEKIQQGSPLEGSLIADRESNTHSRVDRSYVFLLNIEDCGESLAIWLLKSDKKSESKISLK